MSELLAHLAQWAVEVVYAFGYGGVFVLIALANLHVPIPTELTLPLAGFLVGQGRFSFVLVLVVSTAAAVAASLVLYFLGLCIGEERLHQVIKPIERFKILYRSDLDKASEVFERHGGKAILIGHLVPSVGALISIPAGIKRMPVLGGFMSYTVLGCGLWNGVFIVLGWVMGAQWVRVEQYMPVIEYVLLAAIGVGIFWFVWHRRRVSR
jgi:membrane protein DedA with SNARE-associated domain